MVLGKVPRPKLRLCYRQTDAPFTYTRAQALVAATAPTAAPPTTARRVVLRATPATLTGLSGRPTLAWAVSTVSDSPVFFDHSMDPKVPHAKTAAAKNACPIVNLFINASLVATRPYLS